jgi:hypothetical protein
VEADRLMADFNADFSDDFDIEAAISYEDCDRETVTTAKGPEFDFRPSGG